MRCRPWPPLVIFVLVTGCDSKGGLPEAESPEPAATAQLPEEGTGDPDDSPATSAASIARWQRDCIERTTSAEERLRVCGPSDLENKPGNLRSAAENAPAGTSPDPWLCVDYVTQTIHLATLSEEDGGAGVGYEEASHDAVEVLAKCSKIEPRVVACVLRQETVGGMMSCVLGRLEEGLPSRDDCSRYAKRTSGFLDPGSELPQGQRERLVAERDELLTVECLDSFTSKLTSCFAEDAAGDGLERCLNRKTVPRSEESDAPDEKACMDFARRYGRFVAEAEHPGEPALARFKADSMRPGLYVSCLNRAELDELSCVRSAQSLADLQASCGG